MLTTPKVSVFVCVCLLAAPAGAALIIPGSREEGPPDPGLADIRLSVDLAVAGGMAVMTFINASSPADTSAAFKEIVVDTCDDDTGTAVLWNPQVLNQPPDVSYTAVDSNGLPCFQGFTTDATALLSLLADPAPPKQGIGPGETLQVQFDTCLPDGAGINDYLAFFDGGSDTGMYSIGFHAIRATGVGGGGLAGLYQGGQPGASTLTVINFMDSDQDGVLDPGEPLLAGWDFLVEGGGYSGMFTTGPGGELVIDLQAGQYTVTAQGMPGWTGTTPYTYDVSIVEGVDATAEFGSIPEPATLAFLAAGALGLLRRRRLRPASGCLAGRKRSNATVS
ncbi:MAG: hypothetical protein AMJ81_06215 [Phycisphaerae bacterium SM23_33]|jgi:hypothetical protein|nr:MAG: hypothetical protein AMJ81_06215 [Phycisphaerae bacterium SM23_33]